MDLKKKKKKQRSCTVWKREVLPTTEDSQAVEYFSKLNHPNPWMQWKVLREVAEAIARMVFVIFDKQG